MKKNDSVLVNIGAAFYALALLLYVFQTIDFAANTPLLPVYIFNKTVDTVIGFIATVTYYVSFPLIVIAIKRKWNWSMIALIALVMILGTINLVLELRGV